MEPQEMRSVRPTGAGLSVSRVLGTGTRLSPGGTCHLIPTGKALSSWYGACEIGAEDKLGDCHYH